MKKTLPSLFLLLILLSFHAHAQRKEIKGQIRDTDTDEPLVGISVMVRGTSVGVATDIFGNFSLILNETLPQTLIISGLGFQPREIIIENNTPALVVNLKQMILSTAEVVITASRVEEEILTSPMAIERLSIRDLRESPAPNFFDAMEAVKGVQMTTISMGFKVPNTRGFANTSNSRFLSMVDGADTQAPGLGVSIANTVGPTELDIEGIEIIPGVSSALYGMNALNGTSNMITKNPFLYPGLSIYHKSGVNHVDGIDFSPRYFTESAFRYAQAYKKWAYKVNIGYLKGTDWVADSRQDLNFRANPNLSNIQNPAYNPLNSYGNESPNRQILSLADGNLYEVRRTGYFEKELVNHDYGISNMKLDGALHYKISDKTEVSYVYRLGSTDAIYQRGNRIRLDNYRIQQHTLKLDSKNYFIQSYITSESTKDSYNLRPMGENMDRAFKSDELWFAQYAETYNNNINSGHSNSQLHQMARESADKGRYQPGTAAFDAKFKDLAQINDWDRGAQLLMQHKLFHVEGQYDFLDVFKPINILVGMDYRNYIINPDGNSFTNPLSPNPFQQFFYGKTGGFVQLSKKFLNEQLKIIGSGRWDKAQYFEAKFNPRLAAVYTINEKHNFRASIQNGFRFPNLFEGFSTVNNGGMIRYGGLEVMSRDKGLFENSYLLSSVDQFQKAVIKDINQGKVKDIAILDNAPLLVRNEYTYLVPEQIKSIDLGYKASLLNNRLYLDLDFYFNKYENFIDQVEIAVPQSGKISNAPNEINPAWMEMESNELHDKYRMWTNSKSSYKNYGYSIGTSYNVYKKLIFSGNYSHAKLYKLDHKDQGLETAFNTPNHIINLTVSDREVLTNFGYSASWRWQSAFDWNSPLANGMVGSYNTLDAQMTLRVPQRFASIKTGATNILNNRYIQYVGGPEIGAFYYLALTLDMGTRKAK